MTHMQSINKSFLFLTTAVLLTTGCAREESSTPAIETDTLFARIEGAYATRTSIDDEEGKFSWADGDELAIHYSNGSYGTYQINPANGSFVTATPSGVIRDKFAVYPAASAVSAYPGNPLRVSFPASYDISDKLDEPFFAPLPMVAVNDEASNDLDFYHVGGIVRLKLEAPSSAHRAEVVFDKAVTGEFEVTFVSGKPVVSAGDPTSSNETVSYFLAGTGASVGERTSPIVLNVPIPCGTYGSVSIKTYDTSDNLLTEEEVPIPNGSFTLDRHHGVRLQYFDEDLKTPLTLEAVEAGTIVVKNTATGPVQYSINGTAWVDIAAGGNPTITVAAGDIVQFRGNNGCYFNNNEPFITCNARCYVYGNIMSMITSEWFPVRTRLTEDYAFSSFFSGNSRLMNHPERELRLPAMSLSQRCYQNMFFHCTSLTRAPELPATELQSSCYSQMFWGCTNLTKAPSLPATTMKNSCYMGMFYGCRSLTTAPELPALNLGKSCYEAMFISCESLTTAPELPAINLAEQCYLEMFSLCQNLTTAPDLPASVLTPRCYSRMFNGCSSLSNIKCLAVDITATGALSSWVDGVAASGTFIKCSEATTWPVGVNGIPEGWTVVDE